jgi:hypothetical protein
VVWTDFAGNVADPTVVTLSLQDPNDDIVTPSVVQESTGIYYADYEPTVVGTWKYRWVATGTITAAVQGEFSITYNFD